MAEHAAQPGPAAVYRHEHPPVRNPIAEFRSRRTVGQRVADRVATMVGSWPFIIVQSVVLLAWIALNVFLIAYLRTHPGAWRAWDPYPFILLNLVLSFQAAYTGPVVMMSQNRQSLKDRLMAENDFQVNRKAEEEIEVIMKHLVHQDRLTHDVMSRLDALKPALPAPDLAEQLGAILRHAESNDRRIRALMAKIGVEA